MNDSSDENDDSLSVSRAFIAGEGEGLESLYYYLFFLLSVLKRPEWVVWYLSNRYY